MLLPLPFNIVWCLKVAWEFFGRANGLGTYAAFRDKIMGYRRSGQPNPVIGCIVLTDPVFLEQAL